MTCTEPQSPRLAELYQPVRIHHDYAHRYTLVYNECAAPLHLTETSKAYWPKETGMATIAR